MKRIWLIGTPEFGNLGDHKISEVELEFLRDRYRIEEIEEVTMTEYWKKKPQLLKQIQKEDILFFHGGGNIGNLWPKSEYIRRDAISVWKKNKKIILPQSICFTDDENGRAELLESKKAYNSPEVILVCRDSASFEFAKREFECKCILTPDIVLYHKQSKSYHKRRGLVLCFRKDKEKILTENEVKLIRNIGKENFSQILERDTVGESKTKKNREAALQEFMKILMRAELVITDRMHCMVFCALTGTPCIAFDNSYGKLKGCYEWIHSLKYIVLVNNIDEMKHYIRRLHKPIRRFPVRKYRKLFLPLQRELVE